MGANPLAPHTDETHTRQRRYTKDKDVSRARSSLFHGRRHFLIFTERFHFFKRCGSCLMQLRLHLRAVSALPMCAPTTVCVAHKRNDALRAVSWHCPTHTHSRAPRPRRYRIRGIKHLVFYELPVYAHFYPEMVNVMESDIDLNVTVCQNPKP